MQLVATAGGACGTERPHRGVCSVWVGLRTALRVRHVHPGPFRFDETDRQKMTLDDAPDGGED